MDNLVLRQAAIDAIAELVSSMSICASIDECNGMKNMQGRALRAIEDLPSAQPELLTVNIAREMDRETIEKLKESLKNAPVLIMAVNDSAQPERTCENCRYLYMEWADEPCDSCTFENSHWKPIVQPERKKGKWIDMVHAPNKFYYATCQECQRRITLEPDCHNFCPNCGCQMEG